MHNKGIGISPDLFEKLDVMRRERERELGIDLSWTQFMSMMAAHWKEQSKSGGSLGRSARSATGRHKGK